MLGTTLLLVEDNPIFLGLLVALFERAGLANLTIRSARSAEEAFSIMGDLRPDWLTVDLSLPGMSGVEAISRFRALLPDAAIVALTEHEPEPFRAAVLAAGADEFVPKSDLAGKLIPALVEARRARISVSTPRPGF